MKSTLALALFCLVGISACAPSTQTAPSAETCACGNKTAECACEMCKGGDADRCTHGHDAGTLKSHSHAGGNSSGSH